MNNLYRQTFFTRSAQGLKDIPADVGYEVAFAGRSNAGKSSAINTLTSQNKLARTSKTPGRTQLLNFFQVTPEAHLVDLPGYGFAKVSIKIKEAWQKNMADYLNHREALQGVIVMMDVRRPLTDYDIQMLEWCTAANLPTHCLITKADKLKRGAAMNTLLKVRRVLEAEYPVATAQLFSSLKKTGIDEAHTVLDRWLGLEHGSE